jgi:hypothetical protein
VPSHLRRVGDLDPRIVTIDFAPEVREAFRDLAAALHFSDQVGADMLSIIREWAEGKKPTVQDVMISLPLMAQEAWEHINATGDKNAKAAWDNISSELLERGFTMENRRWMTGQGEPTSKAR